MKKLFAASAALACGIALAPTATALPPGGASGNTPGTHAEFTSATTLKAGENLSVRISGFAPNSTVSIKVDDGKGYSNTGVQFTGVVGRITTDSTGAGSTTFEVPCEISARQDKPHTLRFLNKTNGKMYSHKLGSFILSGKAAHCG